MADGESRPSRIKGWLTIIAIGLAAAGAMIVALALAPRAQGVEVVCAMTPAGALEVADGWTAGVELVDELRPVEVAAFLRSMNGAPFPDPYNASRVEVWRAPGSPYEWFLGIRGECSSFLIARRAGTREIFRAPPTSALELEMGI